MQAVNTALIDFYWQVGQTISQKIAQAQWGDGVGVMRQFYEAYQGDAIVSPLARLLQWTKRELERQFKTALFERTVLHPIKVSPLVSQTHPEADLQVGGRDFALDLLFFHRGLEVDFSMKISL